MRQVLDFVSAASCRQRWRRKVAATCDEAGVAVVEFAIVLPFLLLILIGAVNLGVILREYQILQNAAREGARFSSLPQNKVSTQNPNATIAQIQNVVVSYLSQENITILASNVAVNQQYPIVVQGSFVLYGSRVTVSYPRSALLQAGFLAPFTQVTLTSEAVFRNLY